MRGRMAGREARGGRVRRVGRSSIKLGGCGGCIPLPEGGLGATARIGPSAVARGASRSETSVTWSKKHAKLAEEMVVRYLLLEEEAERTEKQPNAGATRIRAARVDLRARGLTWSEARMLGLIRTPMRAHQGVAGPGVRRAAKKLLRDGRNPN